MFILQNIFFHSFRCEFQGTVTDYGPRLLDGVDLNSQHKSGLMFDQFL